MKWLNLLLFVVCSSGLGLYAQAGTSFVSSRTYTVDFSITMKDLYEAAKSEDDRAIPTNRALLLDGDIGSILVHEDTDSGFSAEVEFLNGVWIGEETVLAYRVYLVFEGSQFRPYFSAKSPKRLRIGQTLLVLGIYEGLGVDYDERTIVPVVKALEIRPLY
ncbi:MAG: hypothetical protein SNJ56_06995 [Termitinemataceae bacterium]